MAADPIYVYGLNGVIIQNIAASVTVKLPAARQLRFAERVIAGALRGDDQTVARFAILDAVEFSLEAGGYTMAAIAVMTGRTIGSAGTTPNVIKTMSAVAGTAFPYFKIQGRSLGESGEDLHVLIPKAILTTPPNGTLQDSQYLLQAMNGEGISDGTNTYQVVWHETAVALPTET